MAAGEALEEFVFALFEFIKQRDGIDYLSTAFSQTWTQKTPRRNSKSKIRSSKRKQRSESNPPRTVEIYKIKEELEEESGSSQSGSNKNTFSTSYQSQRSLQQANKPNLKRNLPPPPMDFKGNDLYSSFESQTLSQKLNSFVEEPAPQNYFQGKLYSSFNRGRNVKVRAPPEDFTEDYYRNELKMEGKSNPKNMRDLNKLIRTKINRKSSKMLNTRTKVHHKNSRAETIKSNPFKLTNVKSNSKERKINRSTYQESPVNIPDSHKPFHLNSKRADQDQSSMPIKKYSKPLFSKRISSILNKYNKKVRPSNKTNVTHDEVIDKRIDLPTTFRAKKSMDLKKMLKKTKGISTHFQKKSLYQSSIPQKLVKRRLGSEQTSPRNGDGSITDSLGKKSFPIVDLNYSHNHEPPYSFYGNKGNISALDSFNYISRAERKSKESQFDSSSSFSIFKSSHQDDQKKQLDSFSKGYSDQSAKLKMFRQSKKKNQDFMKALKRSYKGFKYISPEQSQLRLNRLDSKSPLNELRKSSTRERRLKPLNIPFDRSKYLVLNHSLKKSPRFKTSGSNPFELTTKRRNTDLNISNTSVNVSRRSQLEKRIAQLKARQYSGKQNHNDKKMRNSFIDLDSLRNRKGPSSKFLDANWISHLKTWDRKLNLGSKRASLTQKNAQRLNLTTSQTERKDRKMTSQTQIQDYYLPHKDNFIDLSSHSFIKRSSQQNKNRSNLLEKLKKIKSPGKNRDKAGTLKVKKKGGNSKEEYIRSMVKQKKELFEGLLDKNDQELAVQIMELIKEYKKERKNSL